MTTPNRTLEPARSGSLIAPLIPVVTLSAVLLVQGAVGQPAPPEFRWIEALIFVLLLLTVGFRIPLAVWLGSLNAAPWQHLGVFCLLALIIPPTWRGVFTGWRGDDVIRDVLPLLFLFMPLVLVPALRPSGGRGCRLLAWALALEGLFFVLRWWWHSDWGFSAVGVRLMGDGGAYLLNAPSVLFAAIFWPWTALRLMLRGGLLRGWGPGLIAGMAAVVCIAALLGAAHRMALLLVTAAALSTLGWHLSPRRWLFRPWRVLLLLVGAAALLLLIGDRVEGAFFHVAEKTRLTGSNARMEEATAALSFAGETLGSALFGQGWGAVLENPAVGGWRVSYTHTMMTYTLFKAGIVGLMVLVLWLAALAPAVVQVWRHNAPLAWALAAPLFTAFSVHTSFKYLDTGILLSLVLLTAAHCTQNQSISPHKM